jgi:TolB-like protein/Tfp pilus assembly protein PilF/tRNA A-37 threonylcarbamoyl transferase component Bud32
MTPERWRQIEEVFQTALDLPEAERRGFIAEACAGDAELRAQVEALVEQYDEAGDFIESPAFATTSFVTGGFSPLAVAASAVAPPADDGRADDPATGRRVGAYKIVREIGRGGMGAVYLAERADSEFRRRVAIKLIKRGMDTDFILRRFRNERQILATLDHPYIARLLDGGTTDDGLPYFVMEYIDGVPLYRYCDERRMTVQERLALFRHVCDAVHYAHRNLVIHRDIKPSNILVTSEGVPKLLDFGIAKLLNPELAVDITIDPTATAMRLMTPEYASPEQVQGLPVSPATDVYSLGVLLYELLTGHRPYRLRNRAQHDITRVICEEEPEPPSAVITRADDMLLPAARERVGASGALDYVYRSRGSTIESLRRELSGDLDNIVMQALSKEPGRRYLSVEEMRDDISCRLEGRPISARPFFAAAPRMLRSAPRAEPPHEETSIAILPLKVVDARREEDTGDDYLGLGLADALITRLGALRRFVLRPTSSVARYGGEHTDPLSAGRDLGVTFVLDGRIRRAGDSIRVTMQLLDVRAGSAVWAGQFDEKFTDVLTLEDAISAQVAEALVPQLTGGERVRLAKRGTDNAEAYEAYMRGRYHWNTFTEEGFARALVYYNRAVAHAPDYALAYAGIADYYNLLGIYAVLPFAETSAAAKEAALKAVSIDDSLPEAYAALGFATLCHDFDWEMAERYLRRTIELSPNYATGRLWYTYFLGLSGRFDEALVQARRAIELDPVTPMVHHAPSWVYYHARRYEESVVAARALVAHEPRYGMGQVFLSIVLSHTRRHGEAVEAALRGVELLGRSPYTLLWLGAAHASAGHQAEARALLAEIEQIGETRYVSPYLLAMLRLNLGDESGAFVELERALTIRDARLAWLGVDPLFDSLRTDARFIELLRSTNNPNVNADVATRYEVRPERAHARKSVAVLPLKVINPSHAGGTGDDYLGVGLADALIARLSAVHRLLVRPTNSVLRYGGEDVDPLTAGHELGVDYIIDGTVRMVGDSIRVTAQLLSVDEGATRWAGRFDEKSADVLQLEDSISEQVAEALIPQLTGEERQQLARRGTNNPEAFEAYLRGRYHWNTFTAEGYAKSLFFYRRAIELDPTYADAYTGIADYHLWIGNFGYGSVTPAESTAAAREAAERAIELDDKLSDPHATLALIALTHDYDRTATERHVRRALELNPHNALARLWRSVSLIMDAALDEAVAEARRALEVEPLTPFVQQHYGWMLYQARRYDESVAQYRKLVEAEPRDSHMRCCFSYPLSQKGQHTEAIAEAEKALELSGGGAFILAGMAEAYAAAGRTDDARATLVRLRELSLSQYVSPCHFARIHTLLGEHEEALAQLEQATSLGDAWANWLGTEPRYDALRSHTRFKELLRRVNCRDATVVAREQTQVAAAAAAAAALSGERAAGERWTGESAAAHTGEKSVAVLPLKVLGPSGGEHTGDEYLGVGLADALITRLSNVRRFIVRPTSSVLRYRGGDTDPLAAGREMGVDYVVDGTIRRSGDSIRVTAQLLSVEEGATRWAGKFDEKSTDVLQLEDSISEQVAVALVPQLTGEERRQLAKRGTDDAEAYEAYMRGRYHWNGLTEDGFAKAIACYNRAISLDPQYPAAHAAVAEYYCWLAIFGVAPPAECLAAAREAARRAVELDDTLAEAHTALGLALLAHKTQWTKTKAHLLRAVELNPSYAIARVWLGGQYAMEGRFDEADAELRRACELDPLNPLNTYNRQWCLYQARRYEESIKVGRDLMRGDPRYAPAYFAQSWALRRVGAHEEAVEAARKGVALGGDTPQIVAALAAAQAEAGRVEEARRLLAGLHELAAKRYVTHYHRALVHLQLGEHDEALDLLAQSVASIEPWVVWLGTEPQLDPLRSDRRFQALLRETGNPTTATPPTPRVEEPKRDEPATPVATGATPAAPATPAARPSSSDPASPPTGDEEARQLYVAGRYYATRRTPEGLRQAIERLEMAVERDPGFALAWAEMADCYALLNWYVEPPPRDAWAHARRAALSAVAADDHLAEAHASLGFVLCHYDRDFEAAERELRRAVELQPDNGVARRWHAFNLSAMGRHDEAVVEIRRAREIMPRSPVMATALANVLFLARRYDEAIAECRRALELDAGSVAANVVLRWSYEMKGMHAEALQAFEQERVFAGDTPTTRAKRAHVLAATGRREEARRVLDELLARRDEQWVTAYEIAVVHSLLGDSDGAFRWLSEAEREHAVGFTFVGVDPHLDHIRADPRFADLMRRLDSRKARAG